MNSKAFLKQVLPPFLVAMLKQRSISGWSGDHATWAEAQKTCTGYDAGNILEKCRTSLLKVKDGTAVYERDSVLFDKIEYSWPVLAGLLRCAAEHEGKLHVLDFGGSLGSSYYQNRSFLSALKEFSWSVVEQSHFVACGKKDFEDQILKFYASIEECLAVRNPRVLLLSGVLQYLEDPYAWIKNFCSFDLEYVIVDLVGLIETKDRITVQKVPPQIYEASYPCWLLNKQKVLTAFSAKYDLVADFDAYIGNELFVDGEKFKYSGFILKRKP